MLTDIKLLKSLVEEYKLNVGGTEFWVPYWIANPALRAENTGPLGSGPFKGKGTPGQINFCFQQSLKRMGLSQQTPEQYRWLMRNLGLGIDCSGFIYHVLNGWLRARGRGALWQHLLIDRVDLVAAYNAKASWRRKGIERSQVEALPTTTSLETACRLFRKNPRMITNVARLTDRRITHGIQRAQDMQPGDLIKMTSKWGDHIAMIIQTRPHEILYAEATEPKEGLGGVGYGRIAISNPAADLDQQGWQRQNIYHPENGSDGVWRLNVLKSVA